VEGNNNYVNASMRERGREREIKMREIKDVNM